MPHTDTRYHALPPSIPLFFIQITKDIKILIYSLKISTSGNHEFFKNTLELVFLNSVKIIVEINRIRTNKIMPIYLLFVTD